ncbi:hypothetical protein MML48_7g00015987 [Holotrichia oblita]|uniref:Uncharacterized protein n=1 Tax=Holotrichia oblita TaxID=644536 RepID=A0ACB9SQI1_HOLOL|nr:hypothetical protein MML48_7g00015987 [Holotrichia oblita]
MDASASSQSGVEKLKHVQKSLANCENERRVMSNAWKRVNQWPELGRNNQILQDQIARLNNELANNEVQKSALESQLRIERIKREGIRISEIKISKGPFRVRWIRNSIGLRSERYRAAQLQAERLLEAREQSHRQQVTRLENQVTLLREQLNQEIKRRQQYVLRSTRAGREMQQLRQALGDSLRTVSQDPSLDALLLEHEARKLDTTLSTTASLPPGLSSYDRRSTTPQPHK